MWRLVEWQNRASLQQPAFLCSGHWLDQFIQPRRLFQSAHLGVVALADVEHGLEGAQEPVLQVLGREAQQACKQRCKTQDLGLAVHAAQRTRRGRGAG